MRELERSLGLVPVVAIALSAMLGVGVFILPGIAAEAAGSSLWLAYAMGALCVLPAAACKAELATAMPTSGGAFVYLDRIFGPLVGTIAGIALWLSSLLKAAFALLGVGVYLVVLADLPIKPTALGLLTLIVALNWVGVQAVSRAQVFVVGGVLLFLAALVLASIPQISMERMARGGGAGITGVVTAASYVVVTFNGVTKIAAIAEEVRNPSKVVPWGIFISLALVTVVYALVSFSLAGTVEGPQLSGSSRPIATWAAALYGTPLAKVAAVFAIVTLTSLANTGLLAASRFPFAMGRDQLLPGALSNLNQRYSTPGAAIAVTGACMGLSIAFLNVTVLAKLASAIVIVVYISNNLAVLAFRESGVGWYRPKFQSPLYPWLPIFGILSGLGLLILLKAVTLYALSMVSVPGLLLFLLYGRHRTQRRGVVLQRGRRTDLITSSADTGPSSVMPENDWEGVESSHHYFFTPADVSDTLTDHARCLVAMFGDERGPEMLVEIGSALSAEGPLPVLHLTEVPEQTILGAVGEAPSLSSLERRIRVMAETEGSTVDFHAVASRDIIRTVHAVTTRVKNEFLVLRFRGRSKWALMPYNPLGWLSEHLPCNLALFRDAGVRYIREIMVYATPGPDDALVVGTADDLARRYNAKLTLVRPLLSGPLEPSRKTEEDYLHQLSQLCEAPATTRLVSGETTVEVLTRLSARFDLLVMAYPNASTLVRMLGTDTDRIIRQAACSVLSLKTPRQKTHETYRRKTASRPPVHLDELFERALVGARLAGSRKEALFEQIGELFARRLDVAPRRIVDALWERERTQNTSVGEGVALPHATLESARHTVVGILTTAQPIDYRAADGERVDVFFVIISPLSERQLHLDLLSSIARLALGTDLLPSLRRAQSNDEVHRIIRGAVSTLPKLPGRAS